MFRTLSVLAFVSLAMPLAAQDAAKVVGKDAKVSLPRLAEPIKILAGGEPISVTTGHAAPSVMDFDQDGRKDLIVGQFGGGKARIYLNIGTDARPEFKDWTFLQAGGQDASVPPS